MSQTIEESNSSQCIGDFTKSCSDGEEQRTGSISRRHDSIRGASTALLSAQQHVSRGRFYLIKRTPSGLTTHENVNITAPPLSREKYDEICNSVSMTNWLAFVVKRLDTAPIHIVDICKQFDIPQNKGIIAVSELNENDILHYHILISTFSRIDAFRRKIGQHITNFNCLKSERVRNFNSLLRYICKNPIEIATDQIFLLSAVHAVINNNDCKWCPDNSKVHPIVKEILDIMNRTHATTMDELITAEPDTMQKYLHKPNLESIIANCRAFVRKPNDVNVIIQRFTNRNPNPGKIFDILDTQNIPVFSFCLDFWSWFFDRSNKKNTFIIQGPSNTGKSYFVRPFASLFQYGEITNGNQFMFENCINKELIVWEEPLINSEHAEKCKLVFEGTTTQVACKFKAPKTLSPTPVLITTNKPIWYYTESNEGALRNRSFIYDFSRTHSFSSQPTGTGSTTHTNSRQIRRNRTEHNRTTTISTNRSRSCSPSSTDNRNDRTESRIRSRSHSTSRRYFSGSDNNQRTSRSRSKSPERSNSPGLTIYDGTSIDGTNRPNTSDRSSSGERAGTSNVGRNRIRTSRHRLSTRHNLQLVRRRLEFDRIHRRYHRPAGSTIGPLDNHFQPVSLRSTETLETSSEEEVGGIPDDTLTSDDWADFLCYLIHNRQDYE